MDAEPTEEEIDLLAALIEDGWPLVVIAPPRDDPGFEQFQANMLSLVRRGLAGIYGRPDDARDLPPAEADAIVTDSDSWGTWMIAATESGNGLLTRLGHPTSISAE